MKNMSFELFVYKSQVFAVRMQGKKPGRFIANFQIGLGAMITQFLMGLCFAKIFSEGQQQWQTKQNAAKAAIKRSEQVKKNARSAG